MIWRPHLEVCLHDCWADKLVLKLAEGAHLHRVLVKVCSQDSITMNHLVNPRDTPERRGEGGAVCWARAY
jgi:hypothetical protein